MDRVVATAGGMDISINRDEIAPPPQMEMFKKDQRFSQAQLELHAITPAMQLKAFTSGGTRGWSRAACQSPTCWSRSRLE